MLRCLQTYVSHVRYVKHHIVYAQVCCSHFVLQGYTHVCPDILLRYVGRYRLLMETTRWISMKFTILSLWATWRHVCKPVCHAGVTWGRSPAWWHVKCIKPTHHAMHPDVDDLCKRLSNWIIHRFAEWFSKLGIISTLPIRISTNLIISRNVYRYLYKFVISCDIYIMLNNHS